MKALLYLALASCAACAPSVTRVAPETTVDLSGRWNDSDSRMVADQMILELVNSDSYKAFAKEKGRKPVILVGSILNKTSEHIDAANYVRRIEVVLHNSGLAELVESGKLRDELRAERADQQDFADPATVARWGREAGADLILFGEMNSETDTADRRRVVNYITTLFLTDLESNKRIWYGQREIKKLIR